MQFMLWLDTEVWAGVEEEDCDEYSCDVCNNIKQKWLALVYHCSMKTISKLS
jgi:hypothetical protein